MLAFPLNQKKNASKIHHSIVENNGFFKSIFDITQRNYKFNKKSPVMKLSIFPLFIVKNTIYIY